MNKSRWIRSILTFSKSDVRGITVLILLILVLLIIRYRMFKRLESYELNSDLSEDSIARIDSGLQHNYSDDDLFRIRQEELEVQPVDPNKASYYELRSIGLSAGVARNLIGYRESGAVFRSPDNLLKVYGLDSSLLAKIKGHLLFKPADNPEQVYRKITRNGSTIELNRSDSAGFEKLPGIGAILSARIVKYRDILGGYYSASQLQEVYGISDSLLLSLSEFIEVDTSFIKKINLNTATLEELEHHPYISRYQAKAILNYRRLMGSFTSTDQLVTNYLIPEDTYYQLLPYLLAK